MTSVKPSQGIQSFCSALEQSLNSTGALPIPPIAVASSLLRTGLGATQTVSAVTMGVFGLLSACALRFDLLKRSVFYLKHGLANIMRAMIEAMPIINIIFAALYDGFMKKRIKYDRKYEITTIPSLWDSFCNFFSWCKKTKEKIDQSKKAISVENLTDSDKTLSQTAVNIKQITHLNNNQCLIEDAQGNFHLQESSSLSDQQDKAS